jgi:hypothetical protein
MVSVGGFDWGPAVNKVTLYLDGIAESTDRSDFIVYANRSSDLTDDQILPSNGRRQISAAYISDENGNRIEKGAFITLILEVGPHLQIASPFQYMRVDDRVGNQWIDYKLTIINTSTQEVWNEEAERRIPLIDEFDLNGRFNTADGISMSYAYFSPKEKQDKYPLIIWLHGGGEG